MTDFKRPVDAVLEALPGTVGEVAAATGYPAGTVLELIGRLRSEGVRVNAVEDGISRGVSRVVDRENPVSATTIFIVDSGSRKG